MKKGLFFFIAAAVLSVPAFFSCSKTGNGSGANTPDSLVLETFSDSATYHLFGNPDLPAIKACISLTAPSGEDTSSAAVKARNDFMVNIMGNGYTGLPMEDAARKFINTCVEEYRESVESKAKNRKKTAEEKWMNYETLISTSTVYNGNGIWCYSCDSYIYTGGAHGLGTTVCFVYDVANSKPIALNEVFKEDSLPDVLKLITERIGKKGNADAYWMELVTVSENFAVGENGITWYYNPYEIAPYYIGTTAVTIPYDELEPHIVKDSPVYSIIR